MYNVEKNPVSCYRPVLLFFILEHETPISHYWKIRENRNRRKPQKSIVYQMTFSLGLIEI